MPTTISLRRLTLKKIYLLAAMFTPKMTSKTLNQTISNMFRRMSGKLWMKSRGLRMPLGSRKRDFCKLEARSRGQRPRKSSKQPKRDSMVLDRIFNKSRMNWPVSRLNQLSATLSNSWKPESGQKSKPTLRLAPLNSRRWKNTSRAAKSTGSLFKNMRPKPKIKPNARPMMPSMQTSNRNTATLRKITDISKLMWFIKIKKSNNSLLPSWMHLPSMKNSLRNS